MLETFGMHKGGKEYRRLVAAFDSEFYTRTYQGANAQTALSPIFVRFMHPRVGAQSFTSETNCALGDLIWSS
jgi:hypothetical protein